MTERKPLPDGLASDIRHLVAELRSLKNSAGLSLAALARRTPYSKSSWERYLNGKALPPQHAVAALGKLSHADPARLAALWELANTAWHARESGDERVPDGEPPAPGGEGVPGSPSVTSAAEARADSGREVLAGGHERFSRRTLIWTAVGVAAVVAASAAALTGAFDGHGPAQRGRDGAAGTGTPSRQLDINCFAASCTGKDPAQAGCGDVWTSALSKIGGVYVELRYSDACKAAWSRISWGHPGDAAQVERTDGRTYERKVRYDTDTFSAMVAAASPSSARACVLLISGVHGCTAWGGNQHLTEAPNPPTSLLTPTTASPGSSKAAATQAR
ncbi:helix-turn-helix domain-containing protein [Actinacidiphila acidipaludis]|uniref:XRE family transcriptional regulator n=1 Tax=Actinacidiphila acidipaludis TaxID=2873382 RepID=A0ABS7QHD2_9ACTN|nr:XRE family transcriptional regulator [Streptomyces acidipaludis]MBY8882565.1 XRE family transcriptional regulator [Streptomyces acidipaludis]